MYLYRVYGACIDIRQIALRDGAGRYHLARIASRLPALWEELEGERPALGFSLLRSCSGELFRAFFESVDQPQRIELPHDPHPPRPCTLAWRSRGA